MDIQKITKHVALALGVIGLILQVIILRKGDDAIEMDSFVGDFSSVSPMILLALSLIFLVYNTAMLTSIMGRMFLLLKSLVLLIGSFTIIFSFWLFIYSILIFIASAILLYVNYDKNKYKRALISIATFALVVLISFVFSEGLETPLKDGEVLSAAGSRWVGAGLRTFYILAVIAVGTMLYSGVKRLFK